VAVTPNVVTRRDEAVPGSWVDGGEKLARCACGRVERRVPRREENVVAVQLQGAGKVDGVVAAQAVTCGESITSKRRHHVR
jgi:hypothetical protein